jgi:putative restriction endonuclease
VVESYNATCSLCGSQLQWHGLAEVEAAHIKPRAALGPDDVRNALALCRTHHWAFDHGLWTATEDLVVRVQRAPGGVPDLGALRDVDGQSLRAPQRSSARPHPDALKWHRDFVFERAKVA